MRRRVVAPVQVVEAPSFAAYLGALPHEPRDGWASDPVAVAHRAVAYLRETTDRLDLAAANLLAERHLASLPPYCVPGDEPPAEPDW